MKIDSKLIARAHGIYRIINLINNKMYIGSSINCYSRGKQHIKYLVANKHNNPKLQRAWNKYGEENFIFEIIELVENQNKLIEREQYYLDTLLFAQEYIKNNDKRFLKIGYNIRPTCNSPLGVKHSEETKKQCSIRSKGEKNGMYGKTHTDEVKKLLSLTNKGRTHTDQAKANMSKAQKGKIAWNKGIPRPEEEKEKISKTLTDKFSGKNSFNYNGGYIKPKNKLELANNGDIDLPDTNDKRNGKSVLQYDSNMNFLKEWPSIKSASDYLNISRGTILNCCNGESRHAGFFIWRFNGEEDVVYKFRYNPILQLDINNNIIAEYDQIVIAAETLKITRYGIGKALKSGKTYCGYYWKRKIIS